MIQMMIDHYNLQLRGQDNVNNKSIIPFKDAPHCTVCGSKAFYNQMLTVALIHNKYQTAKARNSDSQLLPGLAAVLNKLSSQTCHLVSTEVQILCSVQSAHCTDFYIIGLAFQRTIIALTCHTFCS